MLKNLSVRKAFALFGASSALVCCVVLNVASGWENWPLQIGASLVLLVGGAMTLAGILLIALRSQAKARPAPVAEEL